MAKITVTKMFEFEAAHWLPGYDGPCGKVHGHTYKLEISITGKIGTKGMVVDFKFLKSIVEKHVIDKLDHTTINTMGTSAGDVHVLLKIPTAENMVLWIREQLLFYFSGMLTKIRLYETSTSYVEWSK